MKRLRLLISIILVVAALAAVALPYAPAVWHRFQLRVHVGRLTSEVPSRRQDAVEALGRIGGSEAVVALVPRLRDTDGSVRASAGVALGKIGDSRAIGALIAALNDPDVSVHESFVQALKRMEQPSIELLVASLGDREASVREFAAVKLGQVRDPHLVERLLARARDNQYYLIRFFSAVFTKIGKPAVEPLIARLRDQDPEIRGFAAMALGTIEDARGVQPLIAALADSERDVRWRAAEALGQIRDVRAVQPMLRLLTDEAWIVRYHAARALGEIPDPQSVEPLLECLRSEEKGVRGEAAWALGQIRDTRAVQPLITCLKDKDSSVRDSAEWALAKVGGPRAVEVFLRRLKDGDHAVHLRAANVLGSTGDRRAIPALRSVLPDWGCMYNLVHALGNLGWRPSTDRERIYSWFGDLAHRELGANWPMVRRVLLNDAASGQERYVEMAVYTIISFGEESEIPELIRILETNGSKDMALAYLNCGHRKLQQAAQDWAQRHGYQVVHSQGRPSVEWGRW